MNSYKDTVLKQHRFPEISRADGTGVKDGPGVDCVVASVVVVTRDRARWLARTLTALKKLAYPCFEIVVVDNDSKDDTRRIIFECGARYVHCESKHGIAFCRQKGVEASSGTIIAFCDDDCVPSPQWLRNLVNRFLMEPDLGLVGGRVVNVGFPEAKGYAKAKRNKGRSKLIRNGYLAFVEDPAEAEFFGNMNLAVRRDVMEVIGGYDLFFNTREEIDLAMRIRISGFKIGYAPKAVLEHHYTGVHLKRRHFFYGPDLVRLYFCMKHQQPRSIREWLVFLGYELKQSCRKLKRIFRGLAAATLKWKPDRCPSLWIDLFNCLSSRLALPWLFFRARNSTRQSNFRAGSRVE